MQRNRNRTLFKKLVSKINALKREKVVSDISRDLKHGKNTYMRIDRLESSSFDMVWIKRIEDCIYDLGEIVGNPKQVTKTVGSIVPVELARKINAESVMHLASHTQYIKDIAENGDVIPNKILNMGAEEDIHTYENRFIATLIRRLVLFIEKRYEFVKKFAPLHDEEILYFKNKSIVDGAEVEIETKIKVKSESQTTMAETSNKYIDRIMKIREYILYFYGSKFMKELKTERDVRNPIVMTNILRKNPKYHKCYELYRFIEKYEGLGVSYKVDENIANFDEQDMKEMNAVMLSNYLALKSKNKKPPLKQNTKQYKPRILTSLDDEEFVYGDLYKGPIEFMRIDKGYIEYLESLVKKDLPVHPTKIEKEYYKEEYQTKTEVKNTKNAIEKTLKRKQKEQNEFDKKAKAMVALREKEERERIAAEQEAARLKEEARIEEIRRQLIESAKAEQPVEEEPVQEEEELVIRDIPVYEEPAEESEPEPAPVEEQVEEVPQEEILPVEEIPEEEPVVEETPTEVIEEQPQEEAPAEEPVEEIAEQEEEVIQEEVQEEEEPQPEVVEEALVEEPAPEQEPEQDLDAIRAQLIADAMEEEPVQEEQPVEEPVEEPQEEVLPVEEEIAPAEEPQEEVEAPVEEEPVSEPEPVEEVKEPEPEPIVEEPAPVEPEPQPVEEVPAEEPVKKPRKPRKPRAKPAPVVEEAPVEEPAPVEPEPEPQPEPEIIEEKPEIPEEKPVSAEILDKPKKKPAPKKKRKPAPKKVKEEPKLEPIPGRFIVKTGQGYYVKKNHYSVYKHEAWVFGDFNEANKLKNTLGGKVVKL